jgi:hypothetical protein
MITRFILLAGSLGSCSAFLAPTSSVVDRVVQLQATRQNPDGNAAGARAAALDTPRHRRDFLMLSAAIASSASIFSKISNAEEEFVYKRDEAATDLTSQLFNPDGSLKDPNSVVVAQEKEVNIAFSVPLSPDSITVNLSTDGSSPSAASDSATKLKATYKLPTKWNQMATSTLPLYYDSSEGKNGKSCNRITIYSVSAPKNLDMSTLEKATKVGVAKSLFMGDISNGYFDQGVLKADLIGGRTARKPIQSSSVPEGIDEQVYYEFDLAFAPLSCPDFKEGNKENLGLGFCPYDNIFLVSATVLNADNNEGGTLVVCVVECNKDEWKIANSDLKRVRSSFIVDRA